MLNYINAHSVKLFVSHSLIAKPDISIKNHNLSKTLIII